MITYTANTAVYHQPTKTRFSFTFFGWSRMMNYYFFIVFFAIECAFLFALFANNGKPVSPFGIGTSLAFITDECGDNVAIFANSWFTVLLNVAFTFRTNSIGTIFPENNKLSIEKFYRNTDICCIILTAIVEIRFYNRCIWLLDTQRDKPTKKMNVSIIIL